MSSIDNDKRAFDSIIDVSSSATRKSKNIDSDASNQTNESSVKPDIIIDVDRIEHERMSLATLPKREIMIPLHKDPAKMNALKIFGIIVGLVAMILIVFFFPGFSSQGYYDMRNNVETQQQTSSLQQLPIESLTGKNLIEYSENYYKTGLLQISDFKQQSDGTYVGTTVTKYAITLLRIAELDRDAESKTLKISLRSENTGNAVGSEAKLLFIASDGSIYYSPCSYLTPPGTKKEFDCIFKNVKPDAKISAIGVKRSIGPAADAIEKLIDIK